VGESTLGWYHILYQSDGEKVMSAAISASEARKSLFPLIERVNEDHTPIEIVSKRGNAVLVSKEDWDAIVETNYLLRSPANAKRLMESVEQWRSGQTTARDLEPDA
jgi:antitoxin YefM